MAGSSDDDDVAGPSARLAPFRAFISYSHADGRIARNLQRRLETYRVPRRLADRVAPLGKTRGAVGPLFRDREDLPASVDLSEAVKQAIARSRTLIVLCSPAAAQSPWVAREIALFRSIHPDRKILAALIAGAPSEAFPPALFVDGTEPVAADFRRSGDGSRLAFLKLVAGMLELPLDALIQRDAHRRQRRVTAVTVAALAVVLVLAAMTILAISERREAERRRADAEGLVEFMLSDLRPRLEGVGRLEIMREVNRRAIGYYEDQGDPESLPDDSLERRARVIGAMGQDDENGGHLDLAEARYQILHRTTEALLAKHPGDPARTLAHARSVNRLALLALTRGRLAEGDARFHQVQQMLGSIAAWGHTRPEWLRLSAFAHGNRCATMLKRGVRGSGILVDCQAAVAFTEQLATMPPADPSAFYDLVFHYLWLARAQFAAGRPVSARRSETRYLALVRTLAARDPDNMLWREQQMELYVHHARILRARDETAAARVFLLEARKINTALVARDRSNAVWSRYRSRIARLLEGETDDGDE
ncbi:toll/interleukin-1 receptor domain-containing protein [Sphingomonas sp. DG1-23]|uniref:toll/interleukin-1 receptor domain-containing protein n=1 Tax=Sphingomonas sp. DG1-23 TaxID=3068316 RepID=UPI00273E6511|nr:toll/interleukin-1 receptor domain-containing protein [Sphingomonas sp. DG1-23]MDP5277948.1 toll/interleukin-1 receptor domain-containing protein [Sphingomonas sp. DG1-23]